MLGPTPFIRRRYIASFQRRADLASLGLALLAIAFVALFFAVLELSPDLSGFYATPEVYDLREVKGILESAIQGTLEHLLVVLPFGCAGLVLAWPWILRRPKGTDVAWGGPARVAVAGWLLVVLALLLTVPAILTLQTDLYARSILPWPMTDYECWVEGAVEVRDAASAYLQASLIAFLVGLVVLWYGVSALRENASSRVAPT